MNWLRIRACLLSLVMSAAVVAAATSSLAADFTPPRLSYIDGRVSFWRAGADEWAPARINTPLASADVLYAARSATVEVQIGPRAFVRARGDTELRFASLEPDFLQLSLPSGEVSLDLRSLPAGSTVELGTPNAAFTIERPGYYRALVEGNVTRFITRRGGLATLTVAGQPLQSIAASEEAIVQGSDSPVIETYVAPPLDAWDRWNYARTEHEIEALSGRYLSPGVYGAGALDQWGSWRVMPDYGTVWVPDRVAPGWVPYSTGSWIWDRYYGWTWVDEAPWGWAPFHYGRWVHIGTNWAWAPGPVLVRPVYAPALVAFFGLASGISVRIGIGGPAISWVALGWGEPLLPWWGSPGFVGIPRWDGWGGPRVVNNIVIDRRTVVNVNNIVYHHTRTPRAVVAVREDQFGRGPVRPTPFLPKDPRELQPLRDAHPVRPVPASLVPASGDTIRPPAAISTRPVIATRPPRVTSVPQLPAAGAKPPPAATVPPGAKPSPALKPQPETKAAPAVQKPPLAPPAPRIVAPPQRPEPEAALPRPSFGERGTERPRPAPAPRLQDMPREAPKAVPQARPAAPGISPQAPQRSAPPTAAPQARPAPTTPSVPRAAPSGPPARALPGRPANEQLPRTVPTPAKPPPQGKPAPKK